MSASKHFPHSWNDSALLGLAGKLLLATTLSACTPLVAPIWSAAIAQEQTASDSDTSADDTSEPLTEDELEVLVARIALYPDELVAVVTSASLFPLQIVEAQRFLDDSKNEKDLKPKDSWDGSIVSLLNYPDIIQMMSEDLEWTQSLGSAIAYQQKDVLIAVQTLRDKAVADGIIKSDDKVTVVNEGDNVVIQATNPEKIYVPQYPPEMLYQPGYTAAPIAYYPDPYPNYYYPTAPFFAAAVTGTVWAATVDWDDWGVWGGDWDGNDVDINCNKCFNDVNIDRDKFKVNDIDWKNVDRSKISFDRNQFSKIDHETVRNDFKRVRDNNIGNRAQAIRKGHDQGERANRVSVDDVRKSKIDGDRVRPNRPSNIERPKSSQNINANNPSNAGNRVTERPKDISRNISKPKPGGRVDARPNGGRPSALGTVGNGKRTQVNSDRGRSSMGGGQRGGSHKQIHRSGGRRH